MVYSHLYTQRTGGNVVPPVLFLITFLITLLITNDMKKGTFVTLVMLFIMAFTFIVTVTFGQINAVESFPSVPSWQTGMVEINAHRTPSYLSKAEKDYLRTISYERSQKIIAQIKFDKRRGAESPLVKSFRASAITRANTKRKEESIASVRAANKIKREAQYTNTAAAQKRAWNETTSKINSTRNRPVVVPRTTTIRTTSTRTGNTTYRTTRIY